MTTTPSSGDLIMCPARLEKAQYGLLKLPSRGLTRRCIVLVVQINLIENEDSGIKFLLMHALPALAGTASTRPSVMNASYVRTIPKLASKLATARQ